MSSKSYEVSIPTRILYDERLDGSELKLYLVIRANCNEQGFSVIKNNKLMSFLGKSDRFVQRNILKLEKLGYIVRLKDVKKKEFLYNENYPRVLWLKEDFMRLEDKEAKKAYLKAHARPETDYMSFVSYLRALHTIEDIKILHVHGATSTYAIMKDGYMYKIKEWDSSQIKLSSKQSKKIFDILWVNRFNFFEDKTQVFNEILNEEEQAQYDMLKRLSHKLTAEMLDKKDKIN